MCLSKPQRTVEFRGNQSQQNRIIDARVLLGPHLTDCCWLTDWLADYPRVIEPSGGRKVSPLALVSYCVASGGPLKLAGRPTRGRRQPLPRVLPALDFEPFDEDGDDNVAPAFDNADLLGLPIALTSLPSPHRYASPLTEPSGCKRFRASDDCANEVPLGDPSSSRPRACSATGAIT